MMRITRSPHVLYLNLELEKRRELFDEFEKKGESCSIPLHAGRKEKVSIHPERQVFHALAKKLGAIKDFWDSQKTRRPTITLHIGSFQPVLVPCVAPRQGGAFPQFSLPVLNAAYKLSVSALIFTVLFFSANFSAYLELARFKWNDWFLTEKKAVVQSEMKSLAAIGPLRAMAVKIPEKLQPFETAVVMPNLAVAPPDTRIVIPRIQKNVPVVTVKTENLVQKNWKGLEKDIMEALRKGVIHYPGTSLPGQKGNVVITGHSSYFPWDPGRFKDVFALLTQVKMGDEIVLFHRQKKYIYTVSEIREVWPKNVDSLKPTSDDRLTLITCTPLGTDLRRLIVTAKLIKVES